MIRTLFTAGLLVLTSLTAQAQTSASSIGVLPPPSGPHHIGRVTVHWTDSTRSVFRQVNVPTLVLHGRDDQAVNAEEGRLLASIIPGARLVLLPSGSHYFPSDREVVVKVVGAINRFIDESEDR